MPGSDRIDQEIEPKIDPLALISYLTLPPRYFSSRKHENWQILNHAAVVCTLVVPTKGRLFRRQARKFLENAEIDPSEINRLVESWYQAGLLTP